MTWTGPRCPHCDRRMNAWGVVCCDCAMVDDNNDDEKEEVVSGPSMDSARHNNV